MPNPTTTHVSHDQDTIVSEIEISASAERVFQALVDPRQVLLWWGQTGVYRCTEFEAMCAQAASGEAQASAPTAALFR